MEQMEELCSKQVVTGRTLVCVVAKGVDNNLLSPSIEVCCSLLLLCSALLCSGGGHGPHACLCRRPPLQPRGGGRPRAYLCRCQGRRQQRAGAVGRSLLRLVPLCAAVCAFMCCSCLCVLLFLPLCAAARAFMCGSCLCVLRFLPPCVAVLHQRGGHGATHPSVHGQGHRKQQPAVAV